MRLRGGRFAPPGQLPFCQAVDFTCAALRLAVESLDPPRDLIVRRARVDHDLFDARDETVAAAGYGLDVKRAAGIVAERPPQLLNVVGQVRLFDEGVGPD